MFVSEQEGTNRDLAIQNALQKRQQILLLADQQATRLRRRYVQAGRIEVDEKYSEKRRKAQANQKIIASSLINSHRMIRIKKKYQLCEEIFSEVQRRLKEFATETETSQDYRLFLLASIVQGLVRMFQQHIYIRCLRRDRKILTEMLKDCIQFYEQFMNIHVGFQYPLELQIANNSQLIERNLENGPLVKSKEDQLGIGGIILSDQTGNIIYKATLDSRMNILKDLCLPDVRALVWGQSSNQPTGQSSNQQSGQSSNQPTGQSNIKPTGQPSNQQTGVIKAVQIQGIKAQQQIK